MLRKHRIWQRLGLTCLALGLAIGLSALPLPLLPSFSEAQPAQTPRVRVEGVWRKVYVSLPDLPLENQYVNRESGQVDPDNTLVSRLIRYHVFVKGRPALYRLDWKMTLAEYLGVFGSMDEETYPSSDTLRKNPTEGDVAAIKQLNRAQRDALIQALLDAFAKP